MIDEKYKPKLTISIGTHEIDYSINFQKIILSDSAILMYFENFNQHFGGGDGLVVNFGGDLLFLFVHSSYLQVSLPLFNTFLILLHIIPSLYHPRHHAPLSHHPTLTHCRAAQRSSSSQQ
jgi:hypothetical protein